MNLRLNAAMAHINTGKSETEAGKTPRSGGELHVVEMNLVFDYSFKGASIVSSYKHYNLNATSTFGGYLESRQGLYPFYKDVIRLIRMDKLSASEKRTEHNIART